ncbi:MAG TPA: response regulator [Candidatus Saccharimonadales bacterium]|nr:response regulator [Candidatus Saccharimonadales bacterium]
MKVLLIDDEESILEVFKQALEQEEIEVITALTATDGMDKARTQHPDIIFLDQILPDMGGNEALQQLKADPDTKRIPIAMLSNFNQQTLIDAAIKIGASEYILKYQIAPKDLVGKAKQLVEEAKSSQ